MEAWIEQGKEAMQQWAPNIVAALVILVVGYLAAKFLTRVFRKVLLKSKLEPTLVSFLGNLVSAILLTFVVLATLGRLGVDTTSFAAVLAAAGLAIGFALQGSLANFAAGVMIIALRPFKVDDVIDVSGTEAIVQDINIFATQLLTKDNRTLIVPNAQLTENVITNYTMQPTRRVDMVFGVGYDDDIRKAKGLLERILNDHPKVLAEPAPQVAVSELADSSVNFVARPWCDTDDYFDVLFDITEQVKLTFDAEGISIPFPQQDVHMHQVAA